MNIKNIEIKVRNQNPEKVRRILKSRNALYKGKYHQKDTYFKISHGRLKLREVQTDTFLIFYDRENKKGPKKSKVMMFRAVPDSSLKLILMKALEVLVVVEKQREIYFINNVKVHIDDVKGLGSFIEIEAADNKGSFTDKELLNQCKSFLNLFEIHYENLISCSYSDLLINKAHNIKKKKL